MDEYDWGKQPDHLHLMNKASASMRLAKNVVKFGAITGGAAAVAQLLGVFDCSYAAERPTIKVPTQNPSSAPPKLGDEVKSCATSTWAAAVGHVARLKLFLFTDQSSHIISVDGDFKLLFIAFRDDCAKNTFHKLVELKVSNSKVRYKRKSALQLLGWASLKKLP